VVLASRVRGVPHLGCSRTSGELYPRSGGRLQVSQCRFLGRSSRNGLCNGLGGQVTHNRGQENFDSSHLFQNTYQHHQFHDGSAFKKRKLSASKLLINHSFKRSLYYNRFFSALQPLIYRFRSGTSGTSAKSKPGAWSCLSMKR
jgi:hypothetical protein